jgi:hypothetical protein
MFLDEMFGGSTPRLTPDFINFLAEEFNEDFQKWFAKKKEEELKAKKELEEKSKIFDSAAMAEKALIETHRHIEQVYQKHVAEMRYSSYSLSSNNSTSLFIVRNDSDLSLTGSITYNNGMSLDGPNPATMEYLDKAIKKAFEERDKRYTLPKAIKYLLSNKYTRL